MNIGYKMFYLKLGLMNLNNTRYKLTIIRITQLNSG